MNLPVNSLKILYVDDNEVNQIYVKKVLSKINVDVISVFSGEAAINYIRDNNDFILVLLDIQMPGIDGFETAKMIKKMKPDEFLPIIFISGVYNTEEFINVGFDIGAIDFIVKPISRSILKYKILAYSTIHNQNLLLKNQSIELEQNREYLKKVLDNIPIEIFKIDAERNITCLKNDSKPQQKYLDVFKQLENDIELCFNNSIQCHQEISTEEDNKTYYYDTTILKLILPDNISNVILTLNDLTERKEREINIQQLNRKNSILNEVNFTLLVAQDLNELFFGFSEILKTVAGYSGIWIGDFNQFNADDDFTINTLAISGVPEKEEIDKFKDNNSSPDFIEFIYEIANTNQLKLIDDLESCKLGTNIFSKNNIDTIVSIPIDTEKNDNFKLILFTNNSMLNHSEVDLLIDIGKLLAFGLNALTNKLETIKSSLNLSLEKEELLATVKNIGEGVLTVRHGGVITVANNTAEEILEIPSTDLIGMKIFDVTQILDNDGTLVLFNPFDLIQNEEFLDNYIGKLTILTKNDKRKIISLKISKIKDNRGYLNDIVIVFSDITDRIRIENQIALSQKMESVGQLAAGIAHEINSPMQFVGDNTYFLNDAFNNVIQYISTLENFISELGHENCKNTISEKMNEIKEELDIDYLLNEIPISISRTQTGIERVSKIVLAMKNFAHPSDKQKTFSNLNQGIEVTITISKNEWKYVADLETQLDENLPSVYCTLDEINQVILNMIINAAHAIEDKLGKNPSGKGKIIISTKKVDENIEIAITDTGKGISKENISRIFDPFYTTKAVGKGTGQGLAIAHDIIVNKHSGLITVESEVGFGTTFHIYLPIIINKLNYE